MQSGRLSQRSLTRGLRREMDRFFDEFAAHMLPLESWVSRPMREPMPVNVWEDDGSVYIEAEAPGLEEDGLDLTVSGHELHLKGVRSPDDVPAGATPVLRERDVTSFSRVLDLPSEIDSERIEASLDRGVLTVSIPKCECARTRRVPVRRGERST